MLRLLPTFLKSTTQQRWCPPVLLPLPFISWHPRGASTDQQHDDQLPVSFDRGRNGGDTGPNPHEAATHRLLGREGGKREQATGPDLSYREEASYPVDPTSRCVIQTHGVVAVGHQLIRPHHSAFFAARDVALPRHISIGDTPIRQTNHGRWLEGVGFCCRGGNHL